MNQMIDFEKTTVTCVITLPYDQERFNRKSILISVGAGFIGLFLIKVFCIKYNIKVVSLACRGVYLMIFWKTSC